MMQDRGDSMEITKREIIASIAIIAVMLTIGFIISGKITEHQIEQNAEHQKAVHIEDKELFEYSMRTNVGNAFVYGDIKPVDTVTYEEIGGEYLYVEKVKEKYTMHTQTYTTSDGKGHVRTHTRTYWTWDRVGSEDKKCKKINFCGIDFESKKIEFPDTDYIDTIKESSHVRYKYYGVPTEHTGTIYTHLADKTISDNSPFYENFTIDEALDRCTSGAGNVIFWIVWIFLICGCVYGFYYLDNKWLED